MQIHELKTSFSRKVKKRVGRGGKRGTFSGRGSKGQRARAGHRIRPAERDVLLKIPKLRGVKHRSLKLKTVVLNVGDLDKKFDAGAINKKLLVELNIIKIISEPVKILGEGGVKKQFQIEGIGVSKGAKTKIEKAGGSINL